MASPKEMLQQVISVISEFTFAQKAIAVLVLAGVLGGLVTLSMSG